jgi:RNA polymerase sigma-70 factor (ECF subfamily)
MASLLTLVGVLRFLRGLVGPDEREGQSDSQLLARFVTQRDEDAFAGLLSRHGPLVLGLCRQVLRDAHAAEDAFQATFLVLARKASSIRKHEALAAWLHRVALNIARTARRCSEQRQAHERQAALMSCAGSTVEPEPSDWQPLLHEEVDRLPRKYRVPVVLCYFEGKTHEETARQLGWPLGTVKGRLARARDLLRARLQRRGLALSAGGFATGLAGSAAQAHIPAALFDHTLRAAVAFAGGAALPAGTVSAEVLTLAQGGLQSMTASKAIRVLVFLVGFTAISLGAALALGLGVNKQSDGPPPPQQTGATEPPPREPDRTKGPEAVNGLKLTLHLDKTETVLNPDGRDIEPVQLRITHANVSDRPLKLELTLAVLRAGSRLEVTGPGVQKTDNPDRRAGPGQPEKITPESFHILQPGEEWPFTSAFPTYLFYGDLHFLNKPGEYRLKVIYCLPKETDHPLAKGSWTGTVTSNVVILNVRSAKKPTDAGKE